MPMIQTDSQHYTDIADAIRDMSGSSEVFYPADMAGGVRSIPQTIGIAPIIYSLEEREVGVWTDGKPLYQKTLYIASIPASRYGAVNHDIQNLDTVTYIHCVGYNTSENCWNTIPRVDDSTTYQRAIRVYNNTQCVITGYSNSQAFTNVYITLRYTKTTDTPGSGTWTPSGVPAHHYSTEEQVIGTWIDGKTLYEKTEIIELSTPVEPNNYTTITLSEFISVKTLLPNPEILGGYFSSHSYISNITPFYIGVNDTGSSSKYVQSYDSTSLIVRTGGDYSNFSSVGVDNRIRVFYVTYRYTKTTD